MASLEQWDIISRLVGRGRLDISRINSGWNEQEVALVVACAASTYLMTLRHEISTAADEGIRAQALENLRDATDIFDGRMAYR